VVESGAVHPGILRRGAATLDHVQGFAPATG
jgi:hypothetical protein